MSDDEKNILFGRLFKFINYKEYSLNNEKKLILYPDDVFFGLNLSKKTQIICKEIKYDFNQSSFFERDGKIEYKDDTCILIDESKKDQYSFDVLHQAHDYKMIIIICHREFLRLYKQDYGIKSFLKFPIFSKNNQFVLKPQKKIIPIKLSKKKIMQSAFISVALSCLSFGISYTLADYSPEKVSTLIKKEYPQTVYCKITPSSYPINPFFSPSFSPNQAATPSLEYFYSKNYLNNNNSLYIYEKNGDFSPFQYKIGNEYIDSTLVTSNYVSLNDQSCYSKLGLNLITFSDTYSDDEENVVAINSQLAINLFGDEESAINKNIDFYLYNFQKNRTGRSFRIVGVFEYVDQNTYYSHNRPLNLFVTNPKTVSMGWSGFEYLFTLPHDINSLDDAILKVIQIGRTFKYNHSFFTITSSNNDTYLNDITTSINAKIKKYNSPLTIISIVGVVVSYFVFLYLYIKEISNIRIKYFETIAKRRICILACAIFLLISLVMDLILLYALNIYFVWKIIILPLIAFLILSFLFPYMFGIILKEFKK